MVETHWRQHSRELWLREGDKNTGYFHRMATAHRRINHMDIIKINGVWLTKEKDVREGVVNVFQHLLTENSDWKADIEMLQLEQINQQEAENLEHPFSEDEIHSALMEMNGDKAPGLDGFTMAFWQRCWVLVKEEVLDLFKEFYEQSAFIKSINNTFLVLLPKKGGQRILGNLGQSVFWGGCTNYWPRQILDASLIANEVIDAWQKREEKGLICKLDIEKAYDSLNWQFFMKVMRKMGFGSKWLGWMWSCISTTKFSVLVNGVPASFFPSSKGLRQGDPLSSYLFVMGMEVLSNLIRRVVEGRFLTGCRIRGGERQSVHISHMLFADDTIVFCEARKEYLTYLSWILFWFEAASGLRINLDKSEIIPVGEVEEMEEMAAELGYKVGSMPSVYLRLPLGPPNKSTAMWDGVEEKMRRRLAHWKHQYISKGGRLILIKSTMASMSLYQMSLFRMPKERKGGLGLRKLVPLNKALLGKWIWRFACEKENMWKQVLLAKYGQEGFGWMTKKANGTFGVGVWKEILKEKDWCWENMAFTMGNGTKIRFWNDLWCGCTVLSQRFPHLYGMAAHRNGTVEEMWDQNVGQGDWDLRFVRGFNDWELDMVGYCATIYFKGKHPQVSPLLELVMRVASPVKMTIEIYSTCVIPISAFFASSLWFGNTAYLHISVAFIQMLKALMPVATFLMAVICGTDKLRCDVFLNMLLVSVGVVISSYGEIHFNVIGTVYQVTGIFAEALRLVLTQVLLQKKGLTLNPITSLYYIAPCSFVFLFVPWYFLEKPQMEISQIQFNFWIFFSNALCALALNFSIFLVIGRTGAVTIRVAGVLKDWILIALSTVIFPESTITGLNIIGYAIALCGVVMYNYLKVKDVRAAQLSSESLPERIVKDWKLEKKSSDIFVPDSSNDNNIRGSGGGNGPGADLNAAEATPLLASARLSHIGRSQLTIHTA
ncbi:putative sugar phosphate/phosphate translocator [Vitis vinifera]|uniref:Putative sugar phosphate/phosphate translocator n=1 Tax=Vitis vinifera TaxID=29760 RepID=A0A438KLM5_VITVI|nr:putative sugar phosphate/phosphate translocator [Vitis vinifera]